MNLCIANVLDAGMLQEVCDVFAKRQFGDGKMTAGWAAQGVKNNLQLDSKDPVAKAALSRIMAAIAANPLFRAAALPKTISSMMFSRYTPGMSYGTHVDNAVMTGGTPIRTDISFTIFVSPPGAYQGGELVIESSGGEQAFKLEPGCALIYPSTSLHRVNPVTSGARDVAVGWTQSLVRNPGHREILFDLDTARRTLFQQSGKTASFDLISKCYANLMRLWVEV